MGTTKTPTTTSMEERNCSTSLTTHGLATRAGEASPATSGEDGSTSSRTARCRSGYAAAGTGRLGGTFSTPRQTR